MVELAQLFEEELHPAYWIIDDIYCADDADALVFTNLNLLKAEQALDNEMGANEQSGELETICVDYEADDQITPDLLEKIILEQEQVEWADEPEEQINYCFEFGKTLDKKYYAHNSSR